MITKNDRNLLRAGRLGANVAAVQATKIRDAFANYFQTANGMVPWQGNVVNRGREPMLV